MKVSRLALAMLCAASPLTAQANTINSTAEPVSVFESRIYRDLFSSETMRNIFSDKALVRQWINIEVAMAKAQADNGVIPQEAYESIKNAAETVEIDFDNLRKGTNKVGRGIKPLLGQLKTAGDENVSSYLHYASTTQDIMDTATTLQIKDAASVVRQDLVTLALQLADLAEQHKNTVMIARSNGQDAIPTTFGLHLTTYMMEIYRHIDRLDEATSRLPAQFGSTVGTLAPYGDKGLQVQASFAKEIGLEVPIAPWNPSRDSFAEVVQTLSLIDATLGRVALDINNYSRTQINEVKEGEGGASSTMPQKRNPRASEFMGGFSRMGKMYNSAALDIMSHTDTRQGSPWILEWSIIPESFMVTDAALDRAQRMFTNLIVNEDQMLENFNASKNYVMSEALMNKLAAKVGRSKAYSDVKAAIKKADSADTLRDVLENNASINQYFSKEEIDHLLNPANYLGSSAQIVDRSVAMVRTKLRQ